MDIQLADLGGKQEVKLLSIEVEQQAETEAQHIASITSAESGKNNHSINLNIYCSEYESGDEVTVNVTLSGDGGFNGGICGNVADETAEAGYKWNNGPGFTSEAGESVTVEWTYVPAGDPQIEIWGMKDATTVVYIDSVSVVKTTDTLTGVSLNSTGTPIALSSQPATPANATPANVEPEKVEPSAGDEPQDSPDPAGQSGAAEGETPDIPKNAILSSGDHSDDSQDE